jgi:hypothetical protein
VHAWMVSAVSPDCDTKMALSSRKIGQRLSHRSDASSSMTGSCSRGISHCHCCLSWSVNTNVFRTATAGAGKSSSTTGTYLRQLLHALAGGEAGVEGGAAGDHDDPAAALDGGQVVRQPAQGDAALLVRIHCLQQQKMPRCDMTTNSCHPGCTAHAVSCSKVLRLGVTQFWQCG